MKLYVVTEGHFLHFPRSVDPDRGVWHRAGGVVDFEDPYIAHAAKGQEYKLAPAPDTVTEPSPLNSKRMAILREEFLGQAKPEPTDDEAARDEGAERAESEGLTGAIEKPNVAKPKRPKAETAKT